MDWRDPGREAKLLAAHPKLASRKGDTLEISQQGAPPLRFTDEKTDEGAPRDQSKLIEVDAAERWAVIFEAGPGTLGYKVVFPKFHNTLELSGCPIWSPRGNAFVALHEDLESGQTQNEASLWGCQDPARQCKRLWRTNQIGVAGVKARWAENQRVEILLARLHASKGGLKRQEMTLSCALMLDKTPLVAKCKDLKPWAQVIE